jgi:hypothetical protein
VELNTGIKTGEATKDLIQKTGRNICHWESFFEWVTFSLRQPSTGDGAPVEIYKLLSYSERLTAPGPEENIPRNNRKW